MLKRRKRKSKTWELTKVEVGKVVIQYQCEDQVRWKNLLKIVIDHDDGASPGLSAPARGSTSTATRTKGATRSRSPPMSSKTATLAA